MRVGIIGCGTLGSAIAAGLQDDASVRAVETTTRATSGRNAQVAAASDVVLLCVKPYDVREALRSIVPSLDGGCVVVSTAAGVTVSDLRVWSEARAEVIRAMPNTPAQAGAAMTVLAREAQTCDDALASARAIFERIGRTLVMDETLMDAVTAISGCGPAFAFVAMEAMIDAAVFLGIPYESARELVAQTLLGSAKLVLECDAHPAALKAAVATPAGRTVRGLLELENGGLRATLMRAAIAAAG